VIVGTIYESFPLQLVWTPLAWHGLLTGAVVIGLARAPRSPLAQAGFWLAVGLGASVWALYWPFERPVLPDTPTLLVYLAAPAVLVALSHWMIDHLAPVPRPPAWLLWLSPVVLAGLWLVQTVVTLDPLRLSIIPVLALVIVAMRGAGAYQAWGARRPLWQHGLVLIAPVTVACLAPWLWATFGAQEVNVPIALGSGLVSLGWFAWLFVGGVRRPTPVLTGARS
jgi:hypothetical protein